MAEKDSQSKSQEQRPERKFSQEQYELLKRCSKNNDMTEWNEWRTLHAKDDICLEGCKFPGWFLRHAKLGFNQLIFEDTGERFYGEVYLDGSHFIGADLREADIQFAHLNRANLCCTHLEGAALMNARLSSAKLWFARLQGADVSAADLRGAELMQAKVDGGTTLWKCQVDHETNAEGVALDRAVIDPGTKQLLQYNIRRMNWQEWYKKGWLFTRIAKRLFIQSFWWISDYGLHTWRIIATFFGFAVAFAVIYWLFPSCVMVNCVVGDIRGLWHAVYFSVVTMTTLGFGDIAANPDSWPGQTLLMLQVILGYVLLAALVTRFAVLFTAGGPAGKFAAKEQKSEQGLKKYE